VETLPADDEKKGYQMGAEREVRLEAAEAAKVLVDREEGFTTEC
jgi:hypothetical protein